MLHSHFSVICFWGQYSVPFSGSKRMGAGSKVGVGVGVAVGVGVMVGVHVGVGVSVAVGVRVGVSDGGGTSLQTNFPIRLSLRLDWLPFSSIRTTATCHR